MRIRDLSKVDITWMEEAACTGHSIEEFYPDRGVSTLEAKLLCKTCPVKRRCLDYALENNETYGICGGKSERERLKMLRASQAQETRPA